MRIARDARPAREGSPRRGRAASTRALTALVATVLVAGCVPETGVLVVVEAERSARDRARSARVRAIDTEGEVRLERELVFGTDGADLPYRLLLTPRAGDPARTFRVEAELLDETGDVFHLGRVRGGFTEGTLGQVGLCLRDACEDLALGCEEGSSCVDGVCVALADAEPQAIGAPVCPDTECEVLGDGAACMGGVCRSGQCCRGCWDGERCRAGDSIAFCGRAGAECAGCAEDEVCGQVTCGPAAFTDFDVGGAHACAIAAGRVFCWGDGEAALGDSSAGEIRGPAPVPLPGTHAWVEVATGDRTACARDEVGRVLCWGEGRGGPGAALQPDTAYVALAVGRGLVCGLRAADESIVCEGDNAYGQLGGGEGATSPHVVTMTHRIVDGMLEASSAPPFAGIEAGVDGAVAWAQDGRAFAWGRLVLPAPGDPTTFEDRSPPGPLLMAPDAARMDVGKASRHQLCLIDDGALSCGLVNEYGEAGTGAESPWVALAPVMAGTSFRDVACGTEMSCAVTTAGGLRCWGRNDLGQVGNGAPGVPVPEGADIGAGTTWTRVEAWDGGCALSDTGELSCWGDNSRGRAGVDSTDAIVSAPLRVVIGR